MRRGGGILVVNALEAGAGAETVYAEMVTRLGARHEVSTLSGQPSGRERHVRLPEGDGPGHGRRARRWPRL